MSSVAILGAGELGGAVAHALAVRDCVARILLIDAAGSVAAGKALDVLQSAPIARFHTTLAGTDDISAVTGTSVCIVADPAKGGGEWSGEDGFALVRRVLDYAGNAPVVFGGSKPLELMRQTARELGAPRQRLIGSAPDALASAVRAIVALEARCSPSEVSVTVLGTPGAFVIPWSEASVGGFALDRVVSQAQLARLEARSARLWPPGPYALGAAAAGVAEDVIRTSRRSHSAFALLTGELGVRGQVAALPVSLGPAGILDVRVPTLNTREQVRLQTALGG